MAYLFGRFARLFLLCSFLVSCTEVTTTSSGVFGEDQTVLRTSIFGPVDRGRNDIVGRSATSRGTDQFVNADAVSPERPSRAIVNVVNNHKVELSLINASIAAAAQAVLGDALGQRFVVSDEVSGRITIQTTGPIEKSALLELFEISLEANRARLVKEGEVLSIVPGNSGNRSFRMAANGVGDGSVIVVAPLKYVSATQMLNLLEPLTDEGLTVVADQNRNMLLLSGTRGQLESAVDALNLFDVDVLEGKSIALVRLRAADPADVVQELTTIFEAEEGGMLEGVIEFIPNSRLSSVLVITSRSQYLSKAQRWIRDLDRTASSNRRYTQTYPLQNRSAIEIAPILNDLIGDLGSERGGDEENRGAGSRVAADEARNALIVRAFDVEHSELVRVLQDLDSTPRQVLIEATIVEVSLKNEASMGVRWFFKSGNFGFGFSDVASGNVGADYPGFSSVFTAGSAEVALNALAGVTDVKVITSPTLMVLNNRTAELRIGDEVPVATRTTNGATGDTAQVVTSIDYRNTGVILNVSPRIGSGGRIVLEIKQEVSDVARTNTSGIDSPTIRQRQIETSVVLQDGMTLVLAGLVQENDTVTEAKIPGLGDIPGVGTLFRSRTSEKGRSELLILIRPHVVETTSAAQEITNLWRSKLSQAGTLVNTGLGTPAHSLEDLFR